MGKQNRTTIELTDKERAVLWSIACWFDKPAVTSSLKHKLYSDRNKDIAEKHDDYITDRIISLGKWLEARRLEKDE